MKASEQKPIKITHTKSTNNKQLLKTRMFNPELLSSHSVDVRWDLVMCLSEKAMAPHSSTLAWKIPWTEEPGGPQSMGSHRVGHD